MSEDVVNEPRHYNQNGIEVIDVIETYAKTDFRLANVIKYVCRCEYKGNKLEDLKKAQWYLARVIEELEYAPDCTGPEEQECENNIHERIAGDAAQHIKLKYYYGEHYPQVGDRVRWTGDWHSAEGKVIAPVDKDYVKVRWYKVGGITSDITSVPPIKYLEVLVPDDASLRIKARHYQYDADEVIGHCANASCQAPLPACDPYIFSGGRTFCCSACQIMVER